jgi:hypothetical protein
MRSLDRSWSNQTMSDNPNERWRELAELLGLPGDAPPPAAEAPAPPRAAAPEAATEAAPAEVDAGPEPDEKEEPHEDTGPSRRAGR